MAETKFPRGSEWSKWDLHIHTPASIVQEYGGPTPEVWEKFILDLESLPKEFKAIGINDYIFLDGYRKVIEYQKQGRLKNIDLILPVIELRLDKFASLGTDDPWKKVNFHIIFSNELNPDIIEANFLKAIQHKLKIEAESGEEDFNEVVTPDTLAELGIKIKRRSSKPINDSDIKTGFNSLAFNFDVIFEKLGAGTFKDKYLTAVGKSEWDTLRWDGSPGTKKTVINKADFVFTALEKPDTYIQQRDKLTEQKVNDKLLDCSDAHKFSSEEKPERRLGNCFTWLKANTTFEGLKQVSKESTRIFVGDIPPIIKRVKENPTRYIKKLSFEKLAVPKLEESWFENLEIEINSGLVAIIGNKGNGKSALTDCIGLVGNTPHHNDFSFLEKSKFRAPRPNRSESFKASINWESNSKDEQTLSLNPHSASVENVKYIPQGFLEKLCNENHQDFLTELRTVIFTHIPDSEKYGKTNLLELESFRSDSIQNEIQQILLELKQANQVVVELEKKDTESYKEQLQSNLEQKKKDLEAHNQIKPLVVEPTTDPAIIEKNKEVSDKIAEARTKLSEFEKLSVENSSKQKTILLTRASLEKVLSSIKLLQNNYDKTFSDITPTLLAIGIKAEDVISLNVKTETINSKITDLDTTLVEIDKLLNAELPDSFPAKISTQRTELGKLQNVLDEPSKNYQKYLDDLAHWTKSEKDVIGDAAKLGTITYLEGEIKYLQNQLPLDIQAAAGNRKKILIRLFNKKNEILDVYRTFYKPITDFISNYGGVLEKYEIQLDIENKLKGFEDKFLSQLSAGAKGSFIGIEEGRKKINEILFNSEWETADGIVAMINTIVDNLKFDKRPGFDNAKREVEKQLKGGYTVAGLYDFLFGLDYLEPTYKLKLNEKNISELSPGERGALLLIFYLALDRNDIPLIIDQPEENLDNQSVFRLLAQFIKKAKEKRQVIIVTHNPNLAVVCDADQIIHVRIEKHNKNKVLINSGALENPEINRTVVDILEGTYEAFDTRDTKYKVIPRLPQTN